MEGFSKRQNKVSRLLQKEIGEIFQAEKLNLFLGAMISVTVVRVSPDLGFAKVYISIFSPKTPINEIYDLVNKNSKKIRFLLGTKIKNQLRNIPELAFFIDDSLDYIENIENLLKK